MLDDGEWEREEQPNKEWKVKEAKCRFHDTIRSHPHHPHAHYNLAVKKTVIFTAVAKRNYSVNYRITFL